MSSQVVCNVEDITTLVYGGGEVGKWHSTRKRKSDKRWILFNVLKEIAKCKN